jgi:hypothetical protein
MIKKGTVMPSFLRLVNRVRQVAESLLRRPPSADLFLSPDARLLAAL